MKFGAFLPAHDIGTGVAEHELLRDVVELAEHADRLGYDYVWLPEHDLVRYIISTDALQQAVAIAARTTRIRIGTAVFVTPLYHPLTLAADIAQADHMTEGRFEPGFGRGGSPFELRQLQCHQDDAGSKQRFAEFTDIVRRAWESDVAIAHHGDHFDFDNAYVLPRPYSDPYPRIWLAATTAGSVAQYADWGFDVQFTPFRRPFEVVEEAFQAFVDAGGHGPTALGRSEFMVNRITYVAPTMEEAREILPIIDHHERVVAAGRADAERVVNGVRDWDPDTVTGRPYEEYMEHCLIGDPDTVAQKLQRYHDLGIDQYSMYTALGQPRWQVERSMELFATEVMPRLRAAV